MSHKATYWAFRQKLPALQKIVLIVLADRHNADSGRCDPSISKVAEDCGMSPDSVRNAIKALREKGLVEAHERFDGPVQLTNFYTFNFHRTSTPPLDNGEYPPLDNSDHPTGQEPPPPLDNSDPNREVEPVIEPFTLVPSDSKKTLKKEFVLPSWIKEEVWDGFVEMRKRIKNPLSDRAMVAAVNKLEKFKKQGHDPNELLDEATLNNWKGVWLPDGFNKQQSSKSDAMSRMKFINGGER